MLTGGRFANVMRDFTLIFDHEVPESLFDTRLDMTACCSWNLTIIDFPDRFFKVAVRPENTNKISTFTRATRSVDSYEVLRRFDFSDKTAV